MSDELAERMAKTVERLRGTIHAYYRNLDGNNRIYRSTQQTLPKIEEWLWSSPERAEVYADALIAAVGIDDRYPVRPIDVIRGLHDLPHDQWCSIALATAEQLEAKPC